MLGMIEMTPMAESNHAGNVFDAVVFSGHLAACAVEVMDIKFPLADHPLFATFFILAAVAVSDPYYFSGAVPAFNNQYPTPALTTNQMF